MNVLFFPTRFYPAMSGGDFYLEELGSALVENGFCTTQARGKRVFSPNIFYFTSDALDFGSLHSYTCKSPSPPSKFILTHHKSFFKLSPYPVLRIPVYGSPNLSSYSYQQHRDSQEIVEETFTLFKKRGIEEEILALFIENGPIFPAINFFIENIEIKTFSTLIDIVKKNYSETLMNYDSNFRSKDHLFTLFNFIETFFNNYNPDIIHSTYLPYMNILYSLLLAKSFRAKSVVTPFLHSFNSRYKSVFIFMALDYFDSIIACTNAEKKVLIDHGIKEEKVKVIPMAVRYEKFQINTSSLYRRLSSASSLFYNPKKKNLQKRLRREFLSYFLSHEQLEKLSPKIHSLPILLFSGHKNYEKGALTILEAIPLLSPMFPSLIVIFLGSSTRAFNTLLKKIKRENKTRFRDLIIINIAPQNQIGYFDRKKILAFNIADIYCGPSRSEAYGISYLEAWATKTPVIAADIPAIKEVMGKGKRGFLVPFGDASSLARAISYLLKHKRARKKIVKKSFSYLLKNNKWSFVSQSTFSLYKALSPK